VDETELMKLSLPELVEVLEEITRSGRSSCPMADAESVENDANYELSNR
jgi:hypothetical protein